MTQRSARSDPRKMELEATRLEEELQSLETEWTRLPRYGWAGVLAIPAGLIWGPIAFGLTLLTTLLLVGTAAYLLYVRRKEAENDLQMLRADQREQERHR